MRPETLMNFPAMAACALLCAVLGSCKETKAPPARPKVPVSGQSAEAKAKPHKIPALAEPVIRLEIPKAIEGTPTDPSVLTLRLYRAAEERLYVEWEYRSGNVINGLIPGDSVSLLLSGDGTTSRVFQLALNPRVVGPDWFTGAFLHLGANKEGRQLTDPGLIGITEPKYQGMTVSGALAAALPPGAATAGTMAVAVIGTDEAGDLRSLAVDPAQSGGRLDPSGFRPFSFAGLPEAPVHDIAAMLETQTRISSAGASLKTAIEKINEDMKAAIETVGLPERRAAVESVRRQRVEILREAYRTTPALLPAMLATLSHEHPDRLSTDELLGPVNHSDIFLSDSLAYSHRLLIRGRFDDWAGVAEALIRKAAGIGPLAVEAIATTMCFDRGKDLPTLAIRFGRGDILRRIATVLRDVAKEPSPKLDTALACIDFCRLLAEPAGNPESEANLVTTLNPAINTLQANQRFDGLLKTLGSLHSADGADPVAGARHWRRIHASAGVGAAGTAVARTLGLLVTSMLNRSQNLAFAKGLSDVIGPEVAPEISAADPSLAQLLQGNYATVSILASSDPAAEIAKWDSRLAPKPGEPMDNDPRRPIAEGLSATITSLEERLGPKWLEANHGAVAKFIRERTGPNQMPQLLLSLSVVLLRNGLPEASYRLTAGLMEAYESASADQPAERKEYTRGYMRRVPLAARIFSAQDLTDSDKSMYDTMPEAEKDQFVQFLLMDSRGDPKNLGLCRVYMMRGQVELALRGVRRLDALLSDRQHHVRLMALRTEWASVLVYYGTPEEVEAGFSALSTVLDVVGSQNAGKYREFLESERLRARWMVRQGDLSGAAAWAKAWLEANPGNESRVSIEEFAKRLEAARLAIEAEQKAIAEEPEGLPTATMQTTEGDITFILYANDAPNTVAHFIATAESGFWNGKLFHRFVPGFVAQAGGDDGTVVHDLPRRIPLEATRGHVRGTISMARMGEDNAGSEHEDTGASDFFIMLDDTSGVPLNGGYAAFGRAVSGMDVIAKLREGSRILSIRITGGTEENRKFRSLPPLFQFG